jgi:hypothetical protein
VVLPALLSVARGGLVAGQELTRTPPLIPQWQAYAHTVSTAWTSASTLQQWGDTSYTYQSDVQTQARALENNRKPLGFTKNQLTKKEDLKLNDKDNQ